VSNYVIDGESLISAHHDRLHLLALRQRVQLALDQLSRGQVATGRDTLQRALIDTSDTQPPEAA